MTESERSATYAAIDAQVAWLHGPTSPLALIHRPKYVAVKIHLRFDDEDLAARTYDKAARELFGKHARLNFPGSEIALVRLGSTVREAA